MPMNQEVRNRRAIDLDELERQLRLGVEAAPRPAAGHAASGYGSVSSGVDPLAELARIVGQEDPFKDFFQNERRTPAATQSPVGAAHQQAPQQSDFHAQLQQELRPAYAGDLPRSAPPVYDVPSPAAPARSRRGRTLAVVGGVMSVAVIGVMAALGMRSSIVTGKSGEIPIIAAKPGPAKERPENPGGTVVPNQNKEIYHAATDKPDAATAKVVNTVEQPVDLATAPKRDTPRVALPSPGSAALPPTSGPSQEAPTSIAALAAQATGTQVPAAAQSLPPVDPARSSATGGNEPKRVRSIPIRVNDPDQPIAAPAQQVASAQAAISPPPASIAADPLPTASVPLPPAAPNRGGVLPAVASPQERSTAPDGASTPRPVPVRAPAARAPAPAPTAAVPQDAGAPLQLIPSQSAAAPRRVASAAPAPAPSTAAEGGGWTVQLASRPTEADASSAAQQLGSRYGGALSGAAPHVVSGQAAGRTVYRVRVGSWSKEKAIDVCEKVKSAGGSCFISRS